MLLLVPIAGLPDALNPKLIMDLSALSIGFRSGREWDKKKDPV